MFGWCFGLAWSQIDLDLAQITMWLGQKPSTAAFREHTNMQEKPLQCSSRWCRLPCDSFETNFVMEKRLYSTQKVTLSER
jgi:hypothetical protein